jgi:hypothetical protein
MFALFVGVHFWVLLYRFSLPGPNHIQPIDKKFVRECKSLLTPTPTTYTSRLAKLTAALSLHKGDADRPYAAWIAEPGASAEYYLGAFSSRDWWLSERPFLIAVTPSIENSTKPNITLLMPEFERLRAQGIDLPEHVRPYVTYLSWQENVSPYGTLMRHLDTPASLLDGEARSFILGGLKEAARKSEQGREMSVRTMSEAGEDFSNKAILEAVDLIRERKDAREVGLLRCANQVKI